MATLHSEEPPAAPGDHQVSGQHLRAAVAEQLDQLLIVSRTSSRQPWSIYDKLSSIPHEIASECNPQLDFIASLLKSWHPDVRAIPGTLGIPEKWKPSPEEIDPERITMETISLLRLVPWIHLLQNRLSFLSEAELRERHADLQSSEPDFLLSTPQGCSSRPFFFDEVDGEQQSIEAALLPNSRWSADTFLDVVSYTDLERLAEAVIPGALTRTPGCWLRCNPDFDFPPSMAPCATPPVDFAVLVDAHIASDLSSSAPKSLLRVNLLHPAVVVGVKGPAPWNADDELSCSEGPPNEVKTTLSIQTELSQAVQCSLDAHLLNWLQSEEGRDVRSVPAWLMVFGVMYDADRLRIVAHFPYTLPTENPETRPTTYGYLSCIVDEIPYSADGRHPDVNFGLDRFRAALALLSLKRHAFRMASLWENSAERWPTSIRSAELAVEAEYRSPPELAISALPDEQQDTIQQHGDDFDESDPNEQVPLFQDDESRLPIGGGIIFQEKAPERSFRRLLELLANEQEGDDGDGGEDSDNRGTDSDNEEADSDDEESDGDEEVESEKNSEQDSEGNNADVPGA